MKPIRALILCFAGPLCGLTAAAQTPDTIREPDSLHQFNLLREEAGKASDAKRSPGAGEWLCASGKS